MATATLQQLMVINKGSSLPLLIKAKSFVLDLVTWALWAYIITFVARYAERIFTKPILESFLFLLMWLASCFSVSAVLVILALYLVYSYRSERITHKKP